MQPTARVIRASREREEEGPVLFWFALILFVAWLLGIGGVYAIGALVHVLLVIALALLIAGLLSRRGTVV
jgi:hypothetical protein